MKLDNREISNQLYTAWENKTAISPVSPRMKTKDIDRAYKIQNDWMSRRINVDNVLIGRKIGLTSYKVQEQLGVDQPDYGMLLEDFRIKNNELYLNQLIQGKAEAEIAVVLKESLVHKNPSFSSLLESIDYVLPCIEVVDSRIENWNINIYDTIADNASSAFFVLGSERVAPANIDWEGATMKMYADQELVSEGDATLCMDNPLNCLKWLANQMIDLMQPLQAGEIVLTGALGPMYNINKTETLQAEIEGLGSVTLNIK